MKGAAERVRFKHETCFKRLMIVSKVGSRSRSNNIKLYSIFSKHSNSGEYDRNACLQYRLQDVAAPDGCRTVVARAH